MGRTLYGLLIHQLIQRALIRRSRGRYSGHIQRDHVHSQTLGD